MDQLKPVIEWCKRNVFWIGCFFLAVTMIGSWVFSSMQLASLQDKRQADIKKQKDAIAKIKKTSAEEEVNAHPNEATKAGMDAEIDNTIRSIVSAWNQRYNEQKSILTWPEDILGKETADFFSKVDVPEKLSDPGQGFEKFRKAFYDRIPKYMNKICREVGTNWQYDPELIEEQKKASTEEEEGGPGGMYGGGPMGGMGMGAPGGEADASMINMLNKYPVTWNEENQALWQRKLTEFAGYDDHPGGIIYPTFMQANMLQQDLWLLEAMFKNIKDVNGGSSSNDLSVIRNIHHVVFGREANAKLGELAQVDSRIFSRVQAAANAMGMQGMDPMDPGAAMAGAMAGYEGMAEMMAGAGGGGDFVGERSAYDRRYVDTAYEPIEASKVKLVLGGATLPEQNLELIVAKRVPFRLAVEMDERKINEFIAICANSEFVFEVNQVRINRYDGNEVIKFNGGATSTAGGGGMGGMYGGMGGDKLGGGMGMGLSLGGPGGDNEGPKEALEPTPVESRTDFMVDVEFYGVVKIYNPVRENFLRLAAGQEVVDETADPELVEEAVADAAATAAAAGQPVPAAAQPNAGAPAQPAAGAPAQPPANDGTAPAGEAADPNAAQPEDNATTS